ncbi:Transposase [Marinibacterium anthonyi]|nr:Transposase [Marinibacterium anthonyi]
MTAYRRLRIPGGTYYFTVRLARRGGTELTDHVDLLRAAYGITCRERPFRTRAIVVLPDHLHAIWTLPPGDADFSTRWRLIKTRFTRGLGWKAPRGASQAHKGDCGLWQRRFWEHAIRDGVDLRLHMDKCRDDPVRHGLVARARDWPLSSVHRVRRADPVG